MDQLIVLQEIYESFSTGCERLHSIDPKSIEGDCSVRVVQLLEGCKQGKIDADLCSELVYCLQDVYEIKRFGDICKKAGLFETAIRCYDKALSKTDDRSVKAVLLNNLGQVYVQYGDLGRAVAYYKKAVKRFECIGDQSGVAHVQGNLGSAYRKAREWDKAIEYCYSSLRAFEGLKDELGAAQLTGSLGRVYAELGEFELAVWHFEKSLRAFQKMGDRRSEAWVLNRLGRVSANRDWEASIKYYNQSLSIFEELGLVQGSAIVLSNIGKVYLDKGDSSLARDYLERSLTLLRKETTPAYLNASAWLAATYSILAKENECKANAASATIEGDRTNEEYLGFASQYYSKAAELYKYLANNLKVQDWHIGMAAGTAALLSTLVQIQSKQEDHEAVNKIDRTISNLNELATINCEELEQLESVKSILTDMREAWSIGQLCKEPWKLANAVVKSIEHFIERDPLPGEVGICIHDALEDLKYAVEEEQKRKDSSEFLKASASQLRKAEKAIQSDRIGPASDRATRLRNAATLIERLIGVETDLIITDASHINELLNYRTHIKALLEIGWVFLINVLPAIDKTDYIYSWDESMNLVENRPAGQLQSSKQQAEQVIVERVIHEGDAASDAKRLNIQRLNDDFLEDGALDETEDEPIIKGTYEPLEHEKNTFREIVGKDALFADGPVVEVISESGSLVPITSQLVYSPRNAWIVEQPEEKHKIVFEADHTKSVSEVIDPEESEFRSVEAHGPPSNTDRIQESVIDEPITEKGGCYSTDNTVPSANPPIEDAEKLYVFGLGAWTRSNMIKLVMALLVVVLTLLAIDVILYLI